MNMYWTALCYIPTADSSNIYICETTDYTAYVGLTVYTKWKRTANILCSWLLSTKKGEARIHTVFSHAELLWNTPAFTLITSGTVERGDVYFCLYQKGRGTYTVLLLVQSLGLRIKSFNVSDLRKTLSSWKYLSPSRKRNCNVLLQKKGRGTDAGIAVFLQCFQSWRYTTETKSSNCQTTSPDGKLLNHQ